MGTKVNIFKSIFSQRHAVQMFLPLFYGKEFLLVVFFRSEFHSFCHSAIKDVLSRINLENGQMHLVSCHRFNHFAFATHISFTLVEIQGHKKMGEEINFKAYLGIP